MLTVFPWHKSVRMRTWYPSPSCFVLYFKMFLQLYNGIPKINISSPHVFFLQSPVNIETILKTIPNRKILLTIMSITKVLSEKATESLGDFEKQFIVDPRAIEVVEKLVLSFIYFFSPSRTKRKINYVKSMKGLFIRSFVFPVLIA